MAKPIVQIHVEGLGVTRTVLMPPDNPDAAFVAKYLKVGDSIVFHSKYLPQLGEITWTRLEDA